MGYFFNCKETVIIKKFFWYSEIEISFDFKKEQNHFYC